MTMQKHIVVYSHGFGVRKDDRGLFTDIAAGLHDAQPIMFDYNEVSETAITVAPLDAQAEKLLQVIADVRSKYPDAVVDLICHSQGCIVAALACPEGVRKTIFTAPPVQMLGTERKIKEICKRYDITFTKEDTVRIPRKDGTTTIIPPEYWRVRDGLDAQNMYNILAERTELIIVTATEDEVLGKVNFTGLSPMVRVIELATGHNFEGESRKQLADLIAAEVGHG